MSGGNQAQAWEIAFPMKSHRMHLIPPATSYDNTYQISTREAEVQSSRFLLQADHITTLSLEHTNISESQKENRSQPKSHCLHKLLGARRHFYHLRNQWRWGFLPKSKFQEFNQGLSLQADLSKESSLKPSYINSFLHNCPRSI